MSRKLIEGLARCLALLLLFSTVTPAAAHDGLPVVASIRQEAGELYMLSVAAPASIPASAFPSSRLTGNCAVVRPGAANSPERARNALFRCPDGLEGVALSLTYRGAKPAVPTLTRVEWNSGEERTILAPPGQTLIPLPAAETPMALARGFFQHGVYHVLSGFDHLLFLVCLILVAGTLRRILVVVTGFTIGHAATISLASLGYVGLPSAPVEAAIALSIVVLAAEIMRDRRDTLIWKHPVAVSSAFGLIHGLGFSSALTEIGLPQTYLPLALISFNLGIEIGQTAFVIACVAVWRLARLMPHGKTVLLGVRPQAALAYFVGIISAYWLLERTVGVVAST